MRKKTILRNRIMLFVLSSSLAIIACFAANDDSRGQKYAIIDIKNDEEHEVQVYIQSGDGKSIGTSSYQISFKIPPKGEKGAKKRITVSKSEMGGEDTFSVIGGTGTFDTLASLDNRCKGLRFGSTYEIVFKPSQTGRTVCEVKSMPINNNTHKRSIETETKKEEGSEDEE